MKNILILLADGFEEIEAISIIDVLRRAGQHVTICNIKEEYVKGAHNVLVKSDKSIDEVNLEEYDAIYLPGGLPGAHNLRDNEKVISLVKSANDSKKLIFAICAAPIVLSKAGIIKDKNVTSYPGFGDQLNCGAYLTDPVVVDENITTSRGPATALLLAYEMLKQLGLEEKSKELRKGMLFDYMIENT